MLKVLLLYYNKVTNDAFDQLKKNAETLSFQQIDLSTLGRDIERLSLPTISKLLSDYSFDAVIVGDIFWTTGQNVCRWCKENAVPCYFLQHGQWIYTQNKMNLQYFPTCTFLFGNKIHGIVEQWPYAQRSQMAVTGSPRYDNMQLTKGNGVYFAPPVLAEQISSNTRWNEKALSVLQRLKGLDKKVELRIHPHYREGKEDVLRDLFPNATFIKQSDNPLVHIPQSYKVLTHRNSTSVLDAIACRKPVVLMNFGILLSYYKKGYFGDLAIESGYLGGCVENLTTKQEVSEYNYIERARPYIYLGNASRRIERIIIYGNEKNTKERLLC